MEIMFSEKDLIRFGKYLLSNERVIAYRDDPMYPRDSAQQIASRLSSITKSDVNAFKRVLEAEQKKEEAKKLVGASSELNQQCRGIWDNLTNKGTTNGPGNIHTTAFNNKGLVDTSKSIDHLMPKVDRYDPNQKIVNDLTTYYTKMAGCVTRKGFENAIERLYDNNPMAVVNKVRQNLIELGILVPHTKLGG